jgi:cytochrome c553
MTKFLVAAPMLVAALSAAPALAQNAPAGDPVKGREKVQMCQGCHGIEGWRTAFPEVYKVPRLAGQHQAYLVRALQAYKSGERSHLTMKAIAASLSDNDMADVAAYYAQPAAKVAGK